MKMNLTNKLKMAMTTLTLAAATTALAPKAEAMVGVEYIFNVRNICNNGNVLLWPLFLPTCVLDEKSPQTVETLSQMAENGYDVDKIVVGKLAIDSALAASHQTIDYSDVRTRADLSKKFKSIDAQAPEEYINFLADQLQLQ